jgi:putative restriction endonuclease
MFRALVLNAYRTQCAVCRLRHGELLDAAHIVPDFAGGPLVVTNGVALCKIHHAAYDNNIVGIRPDYVTEVRADLLAEEDGPMLRHGLQGIHGQRILLPRSPAQHPDTTALELRYEQFRVA